MFKTDSIQLDEKFIEVEIKFKVTFVETHSIPLPASSAIATPLCGAPETKVKITNAAITSQSMYVEIQQFCFSSRDIVIPGLPTCLAGYQLPPHHHRRLRFVFLRICVFMVSWYTGVCETEIID